MYFLQYLTLILLELHDFDGSFSPKLDHKHELQDASCALYATASYSLLNVSGKTILSYINIIFL